MLVEFDATLDDFVDAVHSTDGNVAIALKYGVIVVRARAFRDAAHKTAFLEELARRGNLSAA